MEIIKTMNGKDATFSLEGRLDTTTAPDLESEVNAIMNDIDSLVFDFANLQYISSAGLRVLLATEKVMSKKGGMKVINVNETIMEVFEITGFADILTIE